MRCLAVLCAVLGMAGCQQAASLYVGPPGTTETHATVTVSSAVPGVQVFQLRSLASLDGTAHTAVLPEQASAALQLPTTYTIRAGQLTGQVDLVVEGLAQDGAVVARGFTRFTFQDGRGVAVPVELGRPCGGDGDCSDGQWCNGEEVCSHGACGPGTPACGAPPVCVSITCVNATRSCDATVDQALCTAAGTYCDARAGCVGGLPGAPHLVGTPVFSHTSATAGTQVDVTFTVSEPLAIPPVAVLETGLGRQVPLVPDDSVPEDPQGLTFHMSFTVRGNEEPGRHDVLLSLLDLAGDTADGVRLGAIQLDFSPPAVVRMELNQPATKAGVEARLSLEFSELVAGVPVVDTQDVPPLVFHVVEQVDGQRFILGFTPSGVETPGPHVLQVHAQDGAGNQLHVAGPQLVLDFQAPSVANAAVVPPEARAGTLVVVTLDLDEAVVAAPAVYAQNIQGGHLPFQLAQFSGTRASYSRILGAAERGIHVVGVSGMADAAGNTASTLLVGPEHRTAYNVDNTAPRIRALTANVQAASYQPPFNLLSVTFVVDEEDTVSSSVAGVPLACVPDATLPGGHACEVSLDPSMMLEEGAALLEVQARDAAGNVGVASVPVRLDFSAPTTVPGGVSVVLTPPPASPLTRVAALGQGGAAAVQLITNEPLGVPPRLEALGSRTIPCTLQSSQDTIHNFSVLNIFSATGHFTFSATLEDGVGNRAVVMLPGVLEMDWTAPAAPLTSASGQVVLERQPWGTVASGGRAVGSLRVAAGTAEPETTLVARDPLTQVELGRALLDAAGGLAQPMALQGAIRADVALVVVDAAGNVSPAAAVQDGEWVASLGFKVAGSASENPHAMEQRAVFLPVPVQSGISESNAAQAGPLATQPVLTQGAASWRRRSGWRRWISAADVAMAALPTTGQLVQVGGCGGVYCRQPAVGTWVLGANGWVSELVGDPEGDGSPVGVRQPVMVPDPLRQVVLLFGEPASPAPWAWNGASWRRLPVLDPEGDGQPEGTTGYAVWDRRRERAVLLSQVDVVAQKAWAWNGSSWRRLPAPFGTQDPAGWLAMDEARGVVVAGTQQEHMWQLDGDTWTQLVTEDLEGDGSPGVGGMISAVFDRHLGHVLILPENPTSVDSNLVAWQLEWTAQGVSWKKLPVEDPEADGRPAQRSRFGLAYDPVAQNVAIQDGCPELGIWFSGCPQPGSETWSFNGRSWKHEGAVWTAPGPRTGAQGAWLQGSGTWVLFGGVLTQGTGDFNNLKQGLVWNGVEMVETVPPTTNALLYPRGRMFHMVFQDSWQDRTMMFGGALGSTQFMDEWWKFEGSDLVPQLLEMDRPGIRGVAAAGFDELRGVGVMFGGCASMSTSEKLDETWEWAGGAWRQVIPEDPEEDGNPSPDCVASLPLTYDAQARRLVLAQANEMLVWEWDGISWRSRPAGAPMGKTAPVRNGLVYNPARQRLTGVGSCGTGAYGEQFCQMVPAELVDGQWQERPLADPEDDGNPPPVANAAMTYDPRRHRTLLFGGNDLAAPGANTEDQLFGDSFDHLWELDDGATTQPAHVLRVRLADLGQDAVVGRATLSVTVGATSQVQGVERAGVNVLVHDGLEWLQVASGAGSATQPEMLRVDVPVALVAIAQRTASRELLVAFTPLGTNGTGTAVVATLHPELLLQHTRP